MKENCKEVILGLDVASEKTGYAIFKGERIIKSGTWRLKKSTCYADLSRQIASCISQYGITQIVAEDIYRDKDPCKACAYQVLAECRGVVKCIAQQYGFSEIYFIAPAIVQRFFGCVMSNGYVLPRPQRKAKMIRVVTELGYQLQKPDADDEADAIGIIITFVEGNRYKIVHPIENGI